VNHTFRDYLEDMLHSAEEVIEFTADMGFEDFRRDRKTINAVIRSLEVMGEGAKKIPDELRLRYPAIPWRDITGMRDKLIHEYHGIDLAIVWQTVQHDIPPLIHWLEKLLQEDVC
jgi:uncharacterized protein with HEPN domain